MPFVLPCPRHIGRHNSRPLHKRRCKKLFWYIVHRAYIVWFNIPPLEKIEALYSSSPPLFLQPLNRMAQPNNHPNNTTHIYMFSISNAHG
jgi:hypothetical protein